MSIAISVVIPLFEAEKYIERAITSLVQQTLAPDEIIVVDNASTDGAVDYIQQLRDPRVRVIRTSVNIGPNGARQMGIEAAHGYWVAFLDSDDWWERQRLEALTQLGESRMADIVFDNHWLIIDGDPKPWSTSFREGHFSPGHGQRLSFPHFYHSSVSLLHPIIRRDFFTQTHLEFPSALYYFGHFAFALESLERGAKIVVTPKPFYFYRSRATSMTADWKQSEDRSTRALDIIHSRMTTPKARALVDRGKGQALTGQHRRHLSRAIHNGQWRLVGHSLSTRPQDGLWLIMETPRMIRRRILKRRAKF